MGEIEEHPISGYAHAINEAFKAMGLILDVPPLAEEMLIEAGFQDVVVKTALWPIGRWPKDKRLKEIGAFARMGSEQALYPFGLSVLTARGWTAEKVQNVCEEIKKTYAQGDKKGSGNSLVGKYYFQG